MKRYDPFQDNKGFGMKECVFGDYVKYSDHLGKGQGVIGAELYRKGIVALPRLAG